jgi:formamidopyrimidine-DNA glycosylase
MELREEWRPVKGCEGLYEVSNFGRVRSLPNRGTRGKFNNGKIKVPQKRGRYLFVRLYKDGKGASFSIHRLVAEAFIPNPYNLPVVDHIDTDCYNNCVSNLRWASHSDNSRNPLTIKHMIENRDAKGGKRASQKVYVQKGEECFEYRSQNEASRKTGVSRRHIWCCLNGKQKMSNGYIFSKTPLQ